MSNIAIRVFLYDTPRKNTLFIYKKKQNDRTRVELTFVIWKARERLHAYAHQKLVSHWARASYGLRWRAARLYEPLRLGATPIILPVPPYFV